MLSLRGVYPACPPEKISLFIAPYRACLLTLPEQDTDLRFYLFQTKYSAIKNTYLFNQPCLGDLVTVRLARVVAAMRNSTLPLMKSFSPKCILWILLHPFLVISKVQVYHRQVVLGFHDQARTSEISCYIHYSKRKH